MTEPVAAEEPTTPLRCLVVEDEALVATWLTAILSRAGIEVVGPVGTLAKAVDLAKTSDIDAAILDVALHRAEVFPAADVLVSRSIPFLFHTGHGDRLQLDQRYPSAPVCVKPTDASTLISTLKALTDP